MAKYNPDISRKFFVGIHDKDEIRAVPNQMYRKTGGEMGVRPGNRPLLDRKQGVKPTASGTTTVDPDNID